MLLAVENLYKEYRTYNTFRERFFAALTLGLLGGRARFPALQNLSFRAGERKGRGEIIGVIGPNGAGKSTLLRVLAGNTSPTRGRVHFAGDVRSILELGVGFSEDLTAVENVYYNGRLFGYNPRRLMDELDRLLDFAELKDFANSRLGTYSTGMQMRLGFALATFERSDLLLVDEALAVGDAAFQQKCVRRFQEFRDQGSLVLVVSHDTAMLHAICDRMLLLDRGEALIYDEPTRVVDEYMELIAARSFRGGDEIRGLEEREYSLVLLDQEGRPRDSFRVGEDVRLSLALKPGQDIAEATVGIHLSDGRGIRAFGTNTLLMGRPGITLGKDRTTRLNFHLKLNLGPGQYSVGFSVHRGRSHASDCYLWKEGLANFGIEGFAGAAFEGLAYLEPRLEIADV